MGNRPKSPVHNFRGLGLDINFPFEPYGIQKNMMNKVTQTLINKEHSLIESPTGTGKTLVLLCSTLAWQKKSKDLGKPFLSARMKKALAAERREKLMKKPCTCGRRPNPSELDELKDAKENGKKTKWQPEKVSNDCTDKPFIELLSSCEDIEPELKKMKTEATNYSPYFKKQEDDPDCIIIDDSDEPVKKDADDFCQIINDDCKSTRGDVTESDKVKEMSTNTDSSKQNSKSQTGDKGFCIPCMALEAEDKFEDVFGEDSADTDVLISAKIKAKIPRIYYGTRTHKQITQVIRELNKTPYRKDLRMCILSSRERSCINEEVSSNQNRNDLCRDLLKSKSNNSSMRKKNVEPVGCPFHPDSNTVALTFDRINEEYDSKAWDIEDAANFGRENVACPYFGARSLQEQADITFSPYNYLLDPTIRNNLNINLKNSIVIFDEAHNIEDICRDSASFVIDTKQIEDMLDVIIKASSHYVQGSNISNAYNYFKFMFLSLKGFLINYPFIGAAMTQGEYLHKKVMTNRNDLLKELKKALDLSPENLAEFKEHSKALKGDDEEDGKSKSDDAQQPALSFNQMQFIVQLETTLKFMFEGECKYLDDYRAVVTKSFDRGTDRPNFNRGYNKPTQKADVGEKYLWQFSLVCMNSGVAFEKIHSLAWSVIVASGTLSPIESLKTELGCQFSNVFEGQHVIGEDRIFASIVPKGPTGIDLNCAWSQSLKLDFQDEVGRVVKDICVSAPNGVLCFFPSYERMENLYQRWFTRGFINDIQSAGKSLFREQKRMTASAFEKELEKYNKNARKSGAVLFAVFRGKVSEGIDFADEAARAVITIGIPYPNIKETNVGLKREYNDIARRTKPHLMPGGDWYAAQAFRALNQALGRCIRHKEDWGAIIMIDSRLIVPSSQLNLSRWLRRNLQMPNDYEAMRRGLEGFVQRRVS